MLRMAYSTYALSRKNYYYPEDLLNPDIPPYGLQQIHRRFHRAANFGVWGSWDLHYCVVDWFGNKSNSVIHRLVRAAAQTGILVAICTLTSHILFLKYPTLHYYGILGLPAGRLYGMSIMDTLLVRHSLREKVKGGRTPTSAIWEIEDLGWPLGRKTSAKGPTALRFPVLAIES
ncbi:hypothetical protein DXG01_001891 [Tephrocybe rancida]|nr:hypothetical protein DXG01_001891 [Tephrocybe rancida]